MSNQICGPRFCAVFIVVLLIIAKAGGGGGNGCPVRVGRLYDCVLCDIHSNDSSGILSDMGKCLQYNEGKIEDVTGMIPMIYNAYVPY